MPLIVRSLVSRRCSPNPTHSHLRNPSVSYLEKDDELNADGEPFSEAPANPEYSWGLGASGSRLVLSRQGFSGVFSQRGIDGFLLRRPCVDIIVRSARSGWGVSAFASVSLS